MDADTTIGTLRAEVARFVEERDWAKYHNPKDVAMGIAVEAAELLETFLWRSQDDPIPPEATDELADVVIYCLSFANAAGIDLSEAVRRKLALNAAKYPASEWRGRAR
jgi:NTP pyrophosphatase (non-canonical NTP hydrolase)